MKFRGIAEYDVDSEEIIRVQLWTESGLLNILGSIAKCPMITEGYVSEKWKKKEGLLAETMLLTSIIEICLASPDKQKLAEDICRIVETGLRVHAKLEGWFKPPLCTFTGP